MVDGQHSMSAVSTGRPAQSSTHYNGMHDRLEVGDAAEMGRSRTGKVWCSSTSVARKGTRKDDSIQ